MVVTTTLKWSKCRQVSSWKEKTHHWSVSWRSGWRCTKSKTHLKPFMSATYVLGLCIVSRYIGCIDTLDMIWLTIYQIKSINSYDISKLIFLAIKSPHKVPQTSVLLHFYQFIANIAIFYAIKYIVIYIMYQFKLLMIRYISDQCSDNELYYVLTMIYNEDI